MIIFGGRGSGNTVYNDLWVYNFEENSWEEIVVPDGPKGRYGFSAFIDENELFIFGGFEGSKGQVYSDFWALDFNEKIWKWRELNSTKYSNEFLGRYHHSITRTPTGGIVIIGGRNMDHTLCLYVEEGESRDRSINRFPDVTSVQVNDSIPSEVVGAWVRSAYDGSIDRDLTSSGQEIWKSLIKQYKITRQIIANRRQKIRELGIDGDGIFSDCTFKIASDHVVPCHKVLLLRNSEFLQCDIGINFSEKSDEIVLSDISFTTFNYLKTFFYACAVYFLPEHVFDVLIISNKYHISGLLNMCECYIRDNLSLFDPFQVLSLALNVKSKHLLEFVKWHMKVNFDEISTQRKFTEIDKEIQAEIYAEQWPGEKYKTVHAEWEKKVAGTYKKDEDKCVVQ